MATLVDHPRLRLVGPVAAIVAFTLGVLLLEDGERTSTPGVVAYGLVLVAAIALNLRDRAPLAVAAVVVLTRVALTWRTGEDGALLPAAMFALFVAARSGPRRRNLLAATAIAVPMVLVVAGLSTDPYLEELPGEAALGLLPLAVADAVRSRDDRLAQRIETEAADRVQAERLRIARDLHDVVAHGLSVITVQSGVAAHLLERDPAQAKDALEAINATGKQSLEELRAMVGVLRSTDDAPLRPTPADPNDLSALLDGAARSGLDVRVRTHGSFPTDVGDACVVAVHRIVQEALTNVARHAGPVAVDLTLKHHDDRVELTVRNDPGESHRTATASTGVGIVGMTERAESLGGALTAGPGDDGGFVVRAIVPHHRPRTEPS